MRRALQLACNGEGRVSPNPMVGAVITHGDRIIGEGFHAFYGGPHAEVNAIHSVRPEDKALLKNSTIYVTLEPCAHHGKTPPCANLIVNTGIPRVVIGSSDPNPLVAGKGVKILQDAGIQVRQGVLEKECNEINKRFFKAHTSPLPWILLKWAQSADGFMAAFDKDGYPKGVKFSDSLSSVWMHRERASVDAIMVGANTERIDNPSLTTRFWGGNSAKKFVAKGQLNLQEFLRNIRRDGITSLMVEGGPALLNSFIQDGFFDEIRIETAPIILGEGLKAPKLPDNIRLIESRICRKNIIQIFQKINPDNKEVKKA